MERRQVIAGAGAAAIGLGVAPSAGQPSGTWAADASAMKANVQLEPESQAVVKSTANPPYLFDLGPEKARQFVDRLQSGPVTKPPVEIEDRTIPGGPGGQVSVRILRPPHAPGPLPVVVYI